MRENFSACAKNNNNKENENVCIKKIRIKNEMH